MSKTSRSARTSTTSHCLLQYLWLPVVVGIIILIAKLLFDHFTDAKQGDLRIFSSADSAAVFLNDSALGYAHAGEPLQLQWPKGQYLLRGEKAGLTLFSATVKIIAGEVNSFRMGLTREEVQSPNETPRSRQDTVGVKTYSVIVTVPDAFENAKIYVDGEWVGNGSCTIPVPGGRRLFRVEHENGWYETMRHVQAEDMLLNIRANEFRPKDVADARR